MSKKNLQRDKNVKVIDICPDVVIHALKMQLILFHKNVFIKVIILKWLSKLV